MAGLPAYMKVRRYVVDLVKTHVDTAVRIESERELAARFKVSRIVARQALKDLVDDGWLRSLPGRGMFIDSARVRDSNVIFQRTRRVLVLQGDGKVTDIDGFFMEILARVFEELKTAPVRLCLVNLTEGADGALDELLSYNPAGVLWLRPQGKHSGAIDALSGAGVPIQVVGDASDRRDDRDATMDYFQAGRLAAAWFLDRGRRNAAFVGYDPASMVILEVFRGWLDARRERGIPENESPRVDSGDGVADKLKTRLTVGSLAGAFVFGSALAAADLAFAGLDPAIATACPVMTDNGPLYFTPTNFVPAARLVLLDPALGALAARRLLQKLENPNLELKPLTLSPSVRNTGNGQFASNVGKDT